MKLGKHLQLVNCNSYHTNLQRIKVLPVHAWKPQWNVWTEINVVTAVAIYSYIACEYYYNKSSQYFKGESVEHSIYHV